MHRQTAAVTIGSSLRRVNVRRWSYRIEYWRRRGCGADAGETSLKLAVPDRLLAQRVLDPAGNCVTDPDDEADEKDGKCELQCCDHRHS
jgi:hypothetical protein